MTSKKLLRLAALAQGAAVISVAGCNQTPTQSAGPPYINAPAPPLTSSAAADDTAPADASTPDASTPDGNAPALRLRPPFMNAPPKPFPTAPTQ
jgi:hypothetical protein